MQNNEDLMKTRETVSYPAAAETLPMMALRGVLVFPHVLTQLDVGRDRSLNAINTAMETDDSRIFLSMQKDASTDEPTSDDVYQVGTVAVIRQMLKLPGGTVRREILNYITRRKRKT